MTTTKQKQLRTPYSNKHYRAAAVLAAALAVASSASAQTRTKADNANGLNLGTSYVENTTIPNDTITLIVDNTLTANRTSNLGGNLSVLGINMNAVPVSTVSRQFQINATANSTLTIFGGGINKAANTSALIINSAVALGADQTWTLNASTGTGTGNFQLNTTSFDAAGFNLNITGAGLLDLRPAGALTLGSTVTIATNVSVNNATAAVTFGGTNTFDNLVISSGKVSGATIGNFGTASNFGDGGTNTAISLGGTNTSGVFEYTGASATSNRTFNMDRRSNGNSILVTDAAATLTLSGTIQNTVGNATGEKNVALTVGGAGNTILNGVISNHAGSALGFATGLIKADAGTLTLGAANTFLGGVTIDAGTVTISANERIANANKLTLNGGNFDVSTFTETLGALDLNGTGGTLTLGSGGTLVFADSSAESWAGSLTIAGTFMSGTSLQFGTTNAGLLVGQLSMISIAGFTDVGLNSSGFLTATVIPEPSSFAALAGLAVLGLVGLRRRRRA